MTLVQVWVTRVLEKGSRTCVSFVGRTHLAAENQAWAIIHDASAFVYGVASTCGRHDPLQNMTCFEGLKTREDTLSFMFIFIVPRVDPLVPWALGTIDWSHLPKPARCKCLIHAGRADDGVSNDGLLVSIPTAASQPLIRTVRCNGIWLCDICTQTVIPRITPV